MKYFNICTKREYEKDGQKKAVWLNCGTLRMNDKGHKFIELAMFPNTTFYVFEQEQKKKEEASEFSG